MKFAKLALALAAPLLLASCLFTPGRFVSTLDIKADRSFTFTYAGEVVVIDPNDQLMRDARPAHGDTDGGGDAQLVTPPALPPLTAEQRAAAIAKQRALGEIFAKEAGYRSVEYLGNNRFQVDYAISGRLDHSFVYPFNLDAKSIIPWIAIEVRKDSTARVSALAFGDADSLFETRKGNGQMNASGREGTFTLTTDATLVMQNNEDGLAPAPGTRIVWRISPVTRAVPTAVVRFAR
jgi:hypothetical protein